MLPQNRAPEGPAGKEAAGAVNTEGAARCARSTRGLPGGNTAQLHSAPPFQVS